jgi:hypothetical protein
MCKIRVIKYVINAKGLTHRQPRCAKTQFIDFKTVLAQWLKHETGIAYANMVDHFAIFITHGLIALALWRMLDRADLDYEAPPAPPVRLSGEGKQSSKFDA